MRRPLQISALAALGAVLGVVASFAAAAEGPPPAKIENPLAPPLDRPLAAAPAAFLASAQKPAKAGACEVLSPDPGFVEEMLLDVSSIGAPGGKKYERRVALVVGNGAYRNVTQLPNPPNDAASMAKMFRALGFTVYRAIDATERSLDDCFTKFKGDLEASDAAGAKADIALFFYAGHGVQLTSTEDNEKRNYMVTVDGDVDRATGKATGFRQIDRVLTEMRKHSKQAVFLYDACRNAPFGEGVVKDVDGHAVRAFDAASGPAPVAEEGERASQAGLFIAYATSPGKTADDAWGPAGSAHSPFTEALLKNLPAPGALLEEALLKAYYSIGELTNWRQTPWTSSSLTAEVRLNGKSARAEIGQDSALWATRSEEARTAGLKDLAIRSALNGLPRRWGETAADTTPFAAARAELYRAFGMRDMEFLAVPREEIDNLEYSADGSLILATSTVRGVFLFDARTGARVATLPTQNSVYDATFSPDGRRVATGLGDDTARIWTIPGGEPISVLGGHAAYVLSVAFSPDGKRAATGSGDKGVRIFDASSGALLMTLQGHDKEVAGVAFSRDGRRLVSIAGSSARIWDAQNGKLLQTLGADRDGDLLTAEFSADGRRVFTAGIAPAAKIWDTVTGAEISSIKLDGAFFGSADFSSDGRFVVIGGVDDKVRMYEMATGAVVKTFTSEVFLNSAVAFSPSGEQVAFGASNGSVYLRTASDAPLLATLAHDRQLTGVSVSEDERRIVTHSGYGPIRIWNAENGRPLAMFAPPPTPPLAVSSTFDARFSPDGKRLVTAHSGGRAMIWDAADGRLLRELKGQGTGDLASAAYSPDGRRVAVAHKTGGVHVWDAAAGAAPLELPRLESKSDLVGAVFSPDGRRILVANKNGGAEFFDAATGAMIEGKSLPPRLNSIAFAPDGESFVVASGDGNAYVLAGPDSTRLAGHRSGVSSAVFSPDSRRVLTGSQDSTAKLWDSATGALLGTIEGHRPGYGWVAGAEFIDDRRIVTASYDETAKIWDAGLYGPELLAAAYALLTDEQRAEVERERVRYWEVDPALLQ